MGPGCKKKASKRPSHERQQVIGEDNDSMIHSKDQNKIANTRRTSNNSSIHIILNPCNRLVSIAAEQPVGRSFGLVWPPRQPKTEFC